MKASSDDEIRMRASIDVPAGTQIHVEPTEGGHLIHIGGSLVDAGPRVSIWIDHFAALDLHNALGVSAGQKPV